MRKLRIILASIFFIGLSLIFLGFGLDWFGWMAKIQFLPSVLRALSSATLLNLAIVALLLLFPLLFGRLYCSTICPLGVLQDIIIWFRRMNGMAEQKMNLKVGQKLPDFKPHVKHFEYSPERKWLRYGILALTVAAIVTGFQTVVVFVAPYSTFGRILGFSIAGFIELIIFFILAWFWGRIWCDAVCPVGTILGIPARVALIRPRIDASKCTHCGRCERSCKSSCISSAGMKIDASRCVACYDCVRRCKEGAIGLLPLSAGSSPNPETEAPATPESDDEGRREFLKKMGVATLALALPGSLVAAQSAKDSGDAPKKYPKVPKADPVRVRPIVPPGAKSADEFYARCTACRLCIESCPNGVLRQSKSLRHLFQPEMSFLEGNCDPWCTVCSDVCPSGAILPFKAYDRPKVGLAVVNPESCLAASKGAKCGRCATSCPAQAIEMGEKDGVRMPLVDPDLCIGCGACEHACPVRPVSAIIVEGIS